MDVLQFAALRLLNSSCQTDSSPVFASQTDHSKVEWSNAHRELCWVKTLSRLGFSEDWYPACTCGTVAVLHRPEQLPRTPNRSKKYQDQEFFRFWALCGNISQVSDTPGDTTNHKLLQGSTMSCNVAVCEAGVLKVFLGDQFLPQIEGQEGTQHERSELERARA